MFVKNDDRYEEMVERMVSFRKKTRKYWQHADGSDRSACMTPATTYANSTDLRNRSPNSSRTWMEHRADERYPVRSALGYQDHDVRNGSNEWSWSCNCLHSKHPVPVHTKGRQTRRSKSHSYCEAPDRNSPWRRWRRCHHGPRKKEEERA